MKDSLVSGTFDITRWAEPRKLCRGQLSEWCEELGQSLLLRHPKNRPPDANKGPPQPGLNNMHPQMHKAMQPMHP
ncbi:zinc finger MIZ domain-containing protein 1 [Biomphalaria glabrata]|nr:zinc finger MIZ domain-containing protein 1 [Biomphalaria glabrata]